MGIKNDAEQLVRDEVARAKNAAGGGPAGCWCALCEMDIVALSLNMLPPQYCRAENYGYAAGLIRANSIAKAVRSAINRVALLPKHLPDGWPATAKDAALVNYTFEVGAALIGSTLDRSGAACGCAHCRYDTLAYALNHYPAKYGVARGGRRRLQQDDLDFMRHELGVLLSKAARVILAHPHH